MSVKREWALMKARVDRLVALASIAPEANEARAEQERSAFTGATKSVGAAMEAFMTRFADSLPARAAHPVG